MSNIGNYNDVVDYETRVRIFLIAHIFCVCNDFDQNRTLPSAENRQVV